MDERLWSAVREGRSVISSTGERLGTVRGKSSYVFEVEVPRGRLQREELYVPHFAVARIEGDEIYLGMSQAELADAYDHYYRYHLSHRSTG